MGTDTFCKMVSVPILSLAPFDNYFRIEGLGEFIIQGTSISAPQVASSVLDLQKEGFNIKEINEMLRLRMAKSIDPKFDQLIINDFSGLLQGEFTQKMPVERLIQQFALSADEVKQEIEALKTTNNVLGPKVRVDEAHSILIAIDKGVSSLTMNQEEWKSILESFKSVPQEARSNVLEKIAAAKVSKVSDLIPIVNDSIRK